LRKTSDMIYAAVSQCDETPAFPCADRGLYWAEVQGTGLAVSYSKQST
jgi:hypothetical protein